MTKVQWTKDSFPKDKYPNIEIGDYTYGKIKIAGQGKVRIGKFCSIAGGCTILLGVDHRADWITTYPFSEIFEEAAHIPGHPRSKGPVIIGHDVWIGQNVTILSDVRIGNGAIIGAGSVVTKDVKPYTIVCGNPAVFKRIRFNSYQMAQAMNELAWWNWPIEKIKANFKNLLCTPEDTKIWQQ